MKAIDLVVTGLNGQGEGVARLGDGRVVFIPSGLPGDRVRVRLAGTRKGVQIGELLEVLEPSRDRIKSRCTIKQCGVCPLRNLSRSAQAFHKRARVVDCLRRIGKQEVEHLLGEVCQEGDGWRYRHRVRLHAAWLGGEWKIGFFEPRSHELAPLQGCQLLWRQLETVAMSFAKDITKLPFNAGLQTIRLVCSRRDDRAAGRLSGRGEMMEYRRSLAWLEDSGLGGVDVSSGDKRWRQGNLELRYDHKRVEEFDLVFEPGLFTQAFPEVNDHMVETVVAHTRAEVGMKILELHAGLGNFTIPLALTGATITAVERERRAAILGQRNVDQAGGRAQFIAAADRKALGEIDGCDVVVLDPPRSGAQEVAQALASRPPLSRVVYVSCDPATLARDARILSSRYRITAIEAFDMFPQTPHVEVIVTFEPA